MTKSPLVVGKEDAEAEGEGDEETHVGEEEPREVLGHRREHLDVDNWGVQGDNSRCSQPPVDIETKVLF